MIPPQPVEYTIQTIHNLQARKIDYVHPKSSIKSLQKHTEITQTLPSGNQTKGLVSLYHSLQINKKVTEFLKKINSVKFLPLQWQPTRGKSMFLYMQIRKDIGLLGYCKWHVLACSLIACGWGNKSNRVLEQENFFFLIKKTWFGLSMCNGI